MPAWEAQSAAFPQMSIYKVHLSPHLHLPAGLEDARWQHAQPLAAGQWAAALVPWRLSFMAHIPEGPRRTWECHRNIGSRKVTSHRRNIKKYFKSDMNVATGTGDNFTKSYPDQLLEGHCARITLYHRQHPAMTLRKTSNADAKQGRQTCNKLLVPV